MANNNPGILEAIKLSLEDVKKDADRDVQLQQAINRSLAAPTKPKSCSLPEQKDSGISKLGPEAFAKPETGVFWKNFQPQQPRAHEPSCIIPASRVVIEEIDVN